MERCRIAPTRVKLGFDISDSAVHYRSKSRETREVLLGLLEIICIREKKMSSRCTSNRQKGVWRGSTMIVRVEFGYSSNK